MRVVYEIYYFKGESGISPSGYVITDESEKFNTEEYESEEQALEVLRDYFRENDEAENEQFIVVKVVKK